jgi:cytochrome c peroxidase
MKSKMTLLKNLFLPVLLCSAISIWVTNKPNHIDDHRRLPIRTAVGDAQLLQQRYETWKRKINVDETFGTLTINLVPADSHRMKGAGGEIKLSIHTGSLTARVFGLEPRKDYGLWITNDAGLYPTSEPNDNLLHVGTFKAEGESLLTLRADLEEILKHGFQVGQVIVAPAACDHLASMVLAGSPALFQRLLAQEVIANSDKATVATSLARLLVPVAHAAESTGFPDVFNDLVTQGEDIFFNETFNGNGRSCGTCHPATNNFTMDVPFIASLPGNDPLFVAEFIPALMFGAPENLDGQGHPRRFENPALMRAFGLIVENLDGMEDLENRFTMRGIPHNIGLTVSVETPPNDLTPPDDRTGWSGDGAPIGIVGGFAASGRLRDFMLGAIVQHYPKTPDRNFTGPSPDFRAPTLVELDAIEAFMLSLGRKNELELTAGAPNELLLKDSDAEAGKVLFRDGVPGGNRTCNGCHGNAGANVIGGANPGNRNFNTGIELFLRNRMNDPNFTVVGEPRPVDGGFGTNPNGDFTSLVPQPGFVNENFGNKRFNSASLVEAADTPPFFHNNVIVKLEDAIAFFNSPEFLADNGGSIPLNSTQIRQVANFLRVINAIDNIENTILFQSDRFLFALGQTPVPNDVLERIGNIMIADTQDAIEVLEAGGLHNTGDLPVNAVKQLEKAMKRFEQAMNASASVTARGNHIAEAQSLLNDTLAILRF